MILVDTCVWSEALRKNKTQFKEIVEKLSTIIIQNQIAIIGPIRQELLSGVKGKKNFEELKNKLSYFSDIILNGQDYEVAALYYNLCQQKGIQGSNTDFLICSVANRLNIPIFTLDKDFKNFQKIIQIKLF